LGVQGVDSPLGYPPIVKSHVDVKGRTIVDQILLPTLVPADVTTCYPAQKAIAGVEAVENTNNYIGWNSGARSFSTATGDFSLSFTFPPVPSGGVICGIAPSNASIGSFSAIEHGLYSSGALIKFYELGVERHTFSASTASSPLVSIQRVKGVVTAVVGGESYRSNSKSNGDKSATAALYAAGDYVDNPVLSKLSSGSSFGDLSLGTANGKQAAITSRDSTLLFGSAFGKNGDQATIPVIGLDGIVTVFDMAVGAQDHGIANDNGVNGAEIPFGVNASEEFYSGIRFILDEPEATAYDTDQLLEASILEGILQDGGFDFDPIIFATITETLQMGAVFDVMIAIDAKLLEVLALPSFADANMVLEAVLSSGISISDYSSQARNEALQYATNIATGAVTRYSGFGFNSFCRVGTELWATRPDGLYKIGGDTDNGQLLSYLIDFAADDQGNPRTKRLENIFFGISTDGRTYARLKDDFGREQTYRLIQRDSSEARINTAKGASSRFWQLRLEGEEASYAEIDNIEWVAATGARRTKR
jgi:hypothetical protein